MYRTFLRSGGSSTSDEVKVLASRGQPAQRNGAESPFRRSRARAKVSPKGRCVVANIITQKRIISDPLIARFLFRDTRMALGTRGAAATRRSPRQSDVTSTS